MAAIRWFEGNIADAVKQSKTIKAIFVVFVEGSDGQSKEMADLLNTTEVSSRLNRSDQFVLLRLTSGSPAYNDFARIYQLVPVPSLFFIGNNGTPLEVVGGGAAGGVAGLTSRIDALLVRKGENSLPSQLSEPSTSPSPSSSQASSSSFITSEQVQSSIASAKAMIDKSTPESTSKAKAQPTSPTEETDLVCEGEVCVRRPRQPNVQVSSNGDKPETSSTSTNTPQSNTDIPSPTVETPTAGGSTVDSPTAPTSGSTPSPGEAEHGSDDSKKEMSVEDKVERAKELLERKKREKIEEEKRIEKEKEIERRAQGKGMAELKRWQHEQELKTLKEERLKAKRDNDLRRAKILEQIAQDRVDRQARFAPTENTQPASPTTPTAPPPQVDTSHITRIQFKMANGNTHTTQLESDSTLGDLRQYVRENIQHSGSFTLSTMYPRRCLLAEEDPQTLRALGLSPSAALLLLRGGATDTVHAGGSSAPVASTAGGFFGMVSHIFWSFLIAPCQDLFQYISGLITGNPARGRGSSEPSSSSADPRASGGVRRGNLQNDSNVKRRRLSGGGGGGNTTGGSSTVRRDGNTYRLRDPRDSDDENSTWNGNSTQQM